jgi:hypothetical protein
MGKMKSTLNTWLDETTQKQTAFKSFEEMLDAEGDYFPTLRSESIEDLKILADHYDRAQKARGDHRRALRSV